MEQLYPLAGTSSIAIASQDDDFLNYWVDKSVEKEILRGAKLRELKERPGSRREKYHVITIGNTKSYCEKKRPKHKNKSPKASRRKGGRKSSRQNSAIRKRIPKRRKLSSKYSKMAKKGCPLRIAELAVPSKRQCIDTWRNKYHILPGVMLHRLQQHIFDLTPVVKIPEAIECFKRHKNLERKKIKQEKLKALKKEVKRNNCHCQIQKMPIKLQECQNMCALFGHKIAKELNRPMAVTLNSELEKISNVVSIEIENIIKKDKGCGRTDRNKKTQAEIAGKISIWIANILEETAYKILDDQLKDLEEEVGPVLDLIDNLIDDVVCACEPDPSIIESSSAETIIVESSTEEKDEEDISQILEDESNSSDENEINAEKFIQKELDKIINSFDGDDQQDTEIENQTQQDIKEVEDGDQEQNEFSDAFDNFDIQESNQDQITNKDIYIDPESQQNTDKDKDLENPQQRQDENIDQDNVQQGTERNIDIGNLEQSIETNGDEDNLQQNTDGNVNQDNLQQSTVMNISQEGKQQSTDRYIEQGDQQKSNDRNIDQDNSQQITDTNIDQDNLQQSTERNVDEDNLQQSTERNEDPDNLQQSTDKNVSDYNLQQSTDRNVDQDNLQQSADRNVDQDNLQQSTDRNVSQDNLQQSTDKNVSDYNLQQSTDRNVDQDNLQQSTDRNVDHDSLQQRADRNVDQNNLQQSTDRNVDQGNLQQSTDRNLSQDALQQSINKNKDQDDVLQSTDRNVDLQDISEDDSNKKVTFSNIDIVTNAGKTDPAEVNFQNIQEIDPNLVFAEPNDHLLTDADEPWPADMTFPILRPSESVSKSITSLGRIMEAEERISATFDEDGNVKVPFTDTDAKLPEADKFTNDTVNDKFDIQDGETNEIDSSLRSISADEKYIEGDQLADENSRASIDSTFDHHVPTETVPYEVTLDKILEEQATQVAEKLGKLLEKAASQADVDKISDDEGIQVSKVKEQKNAVYAKEEGTQVTTKEANKKEKTADKEINTSFSLVQREDKSTSVVSKSLENITKHIQGVKPDDMFSSLRIKQKVDYKVNKQSAPYWVTRHYEEPSVSFTAPQKKTSDKHIRLWCKDLENGFDNLELWNGWIENTLGNLSILERKKARICIDKSREEFVRDWYQLKKNVDTDVLTWTKLNRSTQEKLKAFRKVYQRFEVNIRKLTPEFINYYSRKVLS